VFALLGLKFPVLLGYWLIGMSVALTSRTNWLSPIATVSGFLLLLAVIRLGQFETEGSEPMKVAKNYAVAIAFALVVISFRGKNFRLFELTGNFNRMMAGFSYSLYLIHFPLMLFLLALIHATFGFEGIATGYSPSSPEGLKIYGGLSVMIYVSAWAFSRLTEARTSGVRRRLKTAIGCN
jgi:peptidoglycan/LPS O-acetylase OafA/YrhL